MNKNYWTDADTKSRSGMPLFLRVLRVSAPKKTYWADADPYWLTPRSTNKPLVCLSEAVFLLSPEEAAINGKCKVRVKVHFLDESARSTKKVTFILFANYQGRTCSLFHSMDAEEVGGFAEAELTLFPPPFYKGDAGNVTYFFKAVHMRGEREVESGRITPVR
jgi:hypothetical protein